MLGRGRHLPEGLSDESLGITLKFTHFMPLYLIYEYYRVNSHSADHYDGYSGIDDVLLDRSKQVRVGSILNNAFSEHEFSPINDEVFSDNYDCHYPTSYPIEDVDPELSEGIIKRHNDRYESLRTADDEPGPLFRDTEDYVVRYIKNRCVAAKLDNAALKQSVVTKVFGLKRPPLFVSVD